MSMDTILKAIRQQGENETHAIETAAYQQANQVMAAARLEAERLQEQARDSTALPAGRERAAILHRARLEALHITGSAREQLVDATLEQLRGYLSSLRRDPRYPQVLRRLTQEALDELSASFEGQRAGAGLQIEAGPQDRELLERLLAEMGLHLPVTYNLECSGGVVAKSQDEQIRVINTIEARLERMTPYLRRSLAALFESDTWPPTNMATPA